MSLKEASKTIRRRVEMKNKENANMEKKKQQNTPYSANR